MERQRVFNYQVSLPHFADLGFLRRAVLRYKMLLLLKQRHPDRFLVPCYDNVSGAAHQTRGPGAPARPQRSSPKRRGIHRLMCRSQDLVWHAHQLQPSYEDDTVALHGKMLNHDDSVNDRTEGSKLNRSSAATHALWKSTFGADFCVDGGMYRGQPPPPLLPSAALVAEQVAAAATMRSSACLCLPSATRKWEWRVAAGTFASPTSVALLPGGEMVTLTPTDGEGAKLATALREATHTARSPCGGAELAIKVIHVGGAPQNSCVQVMDSTGHELASARLVDTTSFPRASSEGGVVGRGAVSLASSGLVRPSSRIDRARRRPVIKEGKTGELGMLVTAGGADYALVVAHWHGFYPGCTGLPGIKGTPGDKAAGRKGVPGVKGVKGVQGKRGTFKARVHPLSAGALAGPLKLGSSGGAFCRPHPQESARRA